MSNSVAMWLLALILAGLAVDFMLYGMDGLLYLFRRLIDLINWVAFWR